MREREQDVMVAHSLTCSHETEDMQTEVGLMEEVWIRSTQSQR